jgi:hypothetical protein
MGRSEDGFTPVIPQKQVYDLLEEAYSGVVYLDDPDNPVKPEESDAELTKEIE